MSESDAPGTDAGGATDAALSRKPTVPGQTTTRLTVDLPVDVRWALGEWCAAAAKELNRARVSQADVVRLLLLRLNEDPELKRFVIDALRARHR